MKTSMPRRATLGAAAVLTAGALLLSGCTSGDDKPEETSTPAPTAEAPGVGGDPSSPSETGGAEEEAPDASGKPPEALKVEDKSLQETAQKYLNVRENQASYNHKKPDDWLGKIKKYMTKDGFSTLKASAGSADEAAGGYAWNISHDKGLAVKVKVGECVALTQAGTNTDTEKTVSCSVSDLVVDKKGKNIPTTDIPSTWPYVGEQQDALLSMKKGGGGWKVDMDMTGMAN